MNIKTIFSIGAGCFIGGVLRYLLSQWLQSKDSASFPIGTLVVNIIGCFFIGIVFSLAEKGNMPIAWRLFLATGLLGGFTTFSAFSMETFLMYRHGYYGMMLTYVLLSLVLGIGATFSAMMLAKHFQ
ncbi:MAG: fluoride efflux transporter CrcB [Bacteroidia bacterium]|jgi:CrcB protein